MKTITTENFLEADPSASAISNMIDADGNISQMNAEIWAGIILEFDLKESIPEDVRNLYQTARGVYLYGYFFYPLFTLGAEQLYRVTEAAAHAKCVQLNAPKKTLERFVDHIEFLSGTGLISDQDLPIWKFFREMRNASSHAKRQNIHTPNFFIGALREVTEEVNKLFD